MIALLMAAATGLLAAPGPAAVHYRGRYRTAEGPWHAVEVWRDGETRLRRRTDDRLEIHAHRSHRGEAPSLVVVDLQRRAAFSGDPAALMEAGVRADWNELARSMAAPRPGQRLVPLGRQERTPLGPCRLYRLAGSSLCWSARWQLPLVIRDRAGRTLLVVESVEEGPFPDEVFRLAPDLQAQLETAD
jgi:hypothetical protein